MRISDWSSDVCSSDLILTKRPERMAEIVRSKIKQVLPNVWLGTSIENAEVSERADALRAIPAAIRFISFEPLIGSVGLIDLQRIHWAIVGRSEERRVGKECVGPCSSRGSPYN